MGRESDEPAMPSPRGRPAPRRHLFAVRARASRLAGAAPLWGIRPHPARRAPELSAKALGHNDLCALSQWHRSCFTGRQFRRHAIHPATPDPTI